MASVHALTGWVSTWNLAFEIELASKIAIFGNYLVCERLRRISLISEDSLIGVTVEANISIDSYKLNFKSFPSFWPIISTESLKT